jgi:hypothetical protein
MACNSFDAGNNVIEVFQTQAAPELSIFSAEEVEILDKITFCKRLVQT